MRQPGVLGGDSFSMPRQPGAPGGDSFSMPRQPSAPGGDSFSMPRQPGAPGGDSFRHSVECEYPSTLSAALTVGSGGKNGMSFRGIYSK
ncbi:hypothetical protein HMPREF9012_0889 [Bacteroidetes bacterium oral taxon 272 str. F0290]|nr:hypothetical protein HMPREF9012_0889 [Bacteroidetes bacterium oral taxon 272 str. F0290]